MVFFLFSRSIGSNVATTLMSLAFGNKVKCNSAAIISTPLIHLFNFTLPLLLASLFAGITGEGVVVVLLDDGLDYESDDLKDNFVSLDSSLL